MGVGQGRVHAGGERAQVDGDLGRELERHLARGEQPGGHALGDRFERVHAVGDELLEHRHGGRLAGGRDELGEARQPRDGAEPGFLGEERRHLEVRVQPRLKSAVGLEQEPLAQHDRGVALVRAEVPFRAGPDRLGPLRHEGGQGGCRPADERGGRGSGRVVVPGKRREDAPTGHRARQRAPGAVTRIGRAQRLAGQWQASSAAASGRRA